jgi:type IV fimbrial biogenesis protein FimT
LKGLGIDVASERKQRCRGYTLIELMVTVAVAAIGLTIAVSGFSGVIASNRLTSTTNEFIGSIRQAQLEAVKRNVSVQFCSNTAAKNTTGSSDTLGNACSTNLGAVYWIDANNNTTSIQGAVQIPPNISIGDGTGGTTAVTALRFGGNGLATTPAAPSTPYNGLVADIYSARTSTNNHRCVYMATGSVLSSCTVTGAAGACNATTEPTPCKQ